MIFRMDIVRCVGIATVRLLHVAKILYTKIVHYLELVVATRDNLTWSKFCQIVGVLAICTFIISGILGIMTFCQVGKENMQTFALELKVMALSGLSALIGHYAGRLDQTPKGPIDPNKKKDPADPV